MAALVLAATAALAAFNVLIGFATFTDIVRDGLSPHLEPVRVRATRLESDPRGVRGAPAGARR